ncbi:unnamed protein product [Rangifer tarandus platyrhynchus]|uniref:Uncharacterized protein n=1 Tax=Rangifer tarandus platyrhynchus TaxID=3082113 RepID=A0AC59YIW3_RANTA
MATETVKGKSDHVPSMSWACAPRSDTIHLHPVLLSSKHPSHSLAALSCCAPCLCPAVPFGPNLTFQVRAGVTRPPEPFLISADTPPSRSSEAGTVTFLPPPPLLQAALTESLQSAS